MLLVLGCILRCRVFVGIVRRYLEVMLFSGQMKHYIIFTLVFEGQPLDIAMGLVLFFEVQVVVHR